MTDISSLTDKTSELLEYYENSQKNINDALIKVTHNDYRPIFNFYVDSNPSNSNASDVSNDGLTSTSPFKTLQKVLDVISSHNSNIYTNSFITIYLKQNQQYFITNSVNLYHTRLRIQPFPDFNPTTQFKPTILNYNQSLNTPRDRLSVASINLFNCHFYSKNIDYKTVYNLALESINPDLLNPVIYSNGGFSEFNNSKIELNDGPCLRLDSSIHRDYLVELTTTRPVEDVVNQDVKYIVSKGGLSYSPDAVTLSGGLSCPCFKWNRILPSSLNAWNSNNPIWNTYFNILECN